LIILVIWALLTLALYKALQGHRVPPGRKEIPALKALRVRKALKGFRVHKESRVQQALKALKVRKALLGLDSLPGLIFNWLKANQPLPDLP